MKRIVFICIAFTLLLSACGGSQPASTAASEPSNTPIPTSTQTPSPTPIPPPPVISASNVMNLQEDFRIGQGGVDDAVWLPDGNVALVYSTGLSIYDPDTGDLIKSVEPENKAIGFSIISPDGKRVAVLMHTNNKVLVWDSNTGKIEYELEARCQVYNFFGQEIAFNRDGSLLAICDEEGVSLWDLSNGTKMHVFKIKRKDHVSVVFNPKNNTLATVGSAYTFTDITIWDLTSGDVIKNLPQISSWIAQNIRFNHQGNILAWSAPGKPFEGPKITLHDINTNQEQTIPADNFAVFEFSPDDKTLTFGSYYGWGIRLLDIATGEFITEPNDNTANLIKYSPDGSRFVAGWEDFSVFKNAGGAELKRLGSFNTYNQIAFDPKGKYLAAGGKFIALWDLQTQKHTFEHIFAYGEDFLFTPDGDGLITNAWKNDNWWANIQQWDISTKNQKNFEGTIAESYAGNKPPLFSPSSDLLAIGALSRKDSYIRFWDANSKEILFDIKHPDLSDYEFSPDGKIFASAGKKTIYFWDLYAQKPSKQIECPKDIYDIAFSPDGALIAAAATNGVYIWDTNSGELISEFNDSNSSTRQAAFSPQGNMLAAIGFDEDSHKILFVWDLSNNSLLYKIVGDVDNNAYRGSGRAGLLFSPGGSFIVTSGLKRQNAFEYIQFWDTASGQLIKTLDYTVGIYSWYLSPFGFSPDGRMFAVADIEGIVHVFHIPASSDNGKEDVLIPTLTPLPPLPTLTPTITPAPTITLTPAPTVSIKSIFSDLSVVKTDSFNNPNNPAWGLDTSGVKIKNGVLQFFGNNWIGGAHYDTNRREGQGIIINFKYARGSEFSMLLDHETWETDPYKRFGVYIVNDGAKTDIWQGKKQILTETLTGNLNFSPDTWYSLLLMVEKNNEFYARIWNPGDPAQTIEYKNTFGADWSGLPWYFSINGHNGMIVFDDFKLVEIK